MEMVVTRGVYEILCIPTGKRYIGSSVRIEQRWAEHRSCLRRRVHKNPKLAHAWNKYSEECFAFSVIEICDSDDDLMAAEQKWLDEQRPAFNINPYADAPWRGRVMPQETKDKIGRAHRGMKRPPGTGAKISAALMGHRHSSETLLKIGAASRGRIAWNKGSVGGKLTMEHRAKISAGLMGKRLGIPGKKATPEHRAKISAALMGKRLGTKHSKESIEKMRIAHLGNPGGMAGKKHTDETKAKISATKRRQWEVLAAKRAASPGA